MCKTLTDKNESHKKAKFMNSDRQTDSQIVRQTRIETDRKTDRQSGRQIDQQTVRQTYRKTDQQTVRQTE